MPDNDSTLFDIHLETEGEQKRGQIDVPRKNGRWTCFFPSFIVLFIFWIVFSGRLDAFHLGLGVLSCAMVAWFSGGFLFGTANFKTLPGVWFRFVRYVPWLLYQILVANIHLLYLSFHPRIKERIDPQIMGFKTQLKSRLALTTLANSITLTPGTITIHISIYGDVRFHVIDIESGKTLPFIMNARVHEIFRE